MPATMKKTTPRAKARAGVGRAGRKAGRRVSTAAATKGGGVHPSARKKSGTGKSAGRAKSAAGSGGAAAKAADAAARRRIAATLDLDALAATTSVTADATARHWATPD